MASSKDKDYYGTLGVSRGASQIEIRRAYRRLARARYPERLEPGKAKEDAENLFKDIVEAYFILGHPERRKIHDQQQISQDKVFRSDAWNFLEPDQTIFDKNAFNAYYTEQRADCEAFHMDWRELLGGFSAKVLAAALFYTFFMIGQNVFPALAVEAFGVRFSVPAFLALVYIVAGTLRDLFWEKIVEDVTYDISVLAFCWLILLGLNSVAVFQPMAVIYGAKSDPLERRPSSSQEIFKKIPVNFEVYGPPGGKPRKEDGSL